MPNEDYDIGKAFKAIEDELIASMIRNLKRHRAEEEKEGKEWTQWQVEQLQALEKYKKENAAKYNKRFKNINAQIGEMIRAARDAGNTEQEIAILNAIKNGFKAMKKTKKGLTGEFFKLNDRKLDALIKATTHDMEKAETAILRMANDKYRKIIFNAQVYANTGAGTYEKAVDMATRDMLNAGLNCVQYANKARHTLSDYADMAIRTANKRAYLQGEGEKRQEWGISTVIMNKRGNACPKCLPFVGKVMIDDVWSGGKKTDGAYLLMSNAIAQGLYHPRCKDSHTTYFPGISTPGAAYTKAELEQIESDYKEEQKEQYARRQAERFERLAKYSLDKDNQKKYVARAEEWKQQAEEIFSDKRIMLENTRKSDIIKSITVDDIEEAISGSELNKEIASKIASVLEKHNVSRIFDTVKRVNIGNNTVFETEPLRMGTFFDISLNINENVLGGMSVEEINGLFENAGNTVANSLEDAIVHEIYHAKLINGLNYSQLENLYDELDSIHVDGLSKTAYKDGAECIAEVGVLIERGEINNVPEKALELLNKYMR